MCQTEMSCFLMVCRARFKEEMIFELKRDEGTSKVNFEERELQANGRAYAMALRW